MVGMNLAISDTHVVASGLLIEEAVCEGWFILGEAIGTEEHRAICAVTRVMNGGYWHWDIKGVPVIFGGRT